MSAIIFHDLQQAEGALRAAVELNRPVTLLTAPGAVVQGGPGFYLAIVEAAQARYPAARVRAILDCGDDGAMAQMALRLGWRHLVLRGGSAMRKKIRQIAGVYGGEVLARPPKSWDMDPEIADPAGQCRAILGCGA